MKPARARTAFTLLEVMVALATSAVLLASLWSLLGIYTRMFTTGQTKLVRSQVIRGLLQQLTDDLHSAIQDTANATGSTAPVGRFGLFGTNHALQIDVLQPPHLRPAAITAQPLDQLDQSRSGPALELRTIRYTFQEPSDATGGDPTSGSPAGGSPSGGNPGGGDPASTQFGLLRREIDWDTPYNQAAASALPPDSSAASDSASPDTDSTTSTTDSTPGATALPGGDATTPEQLLALGQLKVNPNDDTVTWIPEVVALEFRYFDGSAWTDSWNSIERKSLPAAVELVVQLGSANDPDLPRPTPPRPSDGSGQSSPSGAASPSDTTSAAPAQGSTGQGASGQGDQSTASSTNGLTCHVVIDLPTAVLHRAPTTFADDNTDTDLSPPDPTMLLDPSSADATASAGQQTATSDQSNDQNSTAGSLDDPSLGMGADGNYYGDNSGNPNSPAGSDQPRAAYRSSLYGQPGGTSTRSNPWNQWMRVFP